MPPEMKRPGNGRADPAGASKQTTLTAQTASGLSWFYLSTIALMVANLAYTATVSRLLAPAAFGLFAIANLSRKLGIEPESALRKANDKFSRRFSGMESRLRATGRSLSECSLQEMEDEWSRIKQAEREAAAGPAAGSGSAP